MFAFVDYFLKMVASVPFNNKHLFIRSEIINGKRVNAGTKYIYPRRKHEIYNILELGILKMKFRVRFAQK